MEYGFVAFIDESGDPGCSGPFRTGQDNGGQSHFLTLSAYLVSRNTNTTLVAMRDNIRDEIKPHAQKRDLHFADLKHEQKVRYCELLSEMTRAKVIAIIINKEHLNRREQFATNCELLYRYACRLLVERISWICDDTQSDNDLKRVKLVFSNRGGTSAAQFKGYLQNLSALDTEIRWQCINEELVASLPHAKRAGLQLADCVASAISSGLEEKFPGILEPRYGKCLKPIFYRYRNGRVSGYGIKIVPDKSTGLSEEQSAYIEALCE